MTHLADVCVAFLIVLQTQASVAFAVASYLCKVLFEGSLRLSLVRAMFFVTMLFMTVIFTGVFSDWLLRSVHCLKKQSISYNFKLSCCRLDRLINSTVQKS